MKDEKSNLSVIGEFRDIITYSDGRVVETEWNRNCILTSINKLVTALFSRNSTYSGLQYWAIGSGATSWDTSQPTPTPEDTGCTNEIGRKAIAPENIVFLEPGTNTVSTQPTNTIRVSLIFGENDCNGTWREFSIYGGNATSTSKSGIPINHKIHGAIVKDNTMTVERQIRFIFS